MTDNVEENLTCYLPAMTEGENRDQVSRLILFTTLWLTLFILSVKVSAGWATRSLSLLAESLHTLLTAFSTFLSLLRITTSEHPTERLVSSHGKRETLITFLLIAFLGFAGLNLLGMSGQQLAVATQREMLIFPIRVNLPLMQLLTVVVVSSLIWALLGIYQAKVLSNLALRFNAIQLLKDVWLTFLVLIGLLAVWWGWVWMDVILAILLVVLAMRSCWQIVSWQLPHLIQQTAIAPEVLAQIVHQVGGIIHCYKIQSRGIVGRLVYIQMHLIVHPDFSEVTSVIIERIEQVIQERYGPAQVTFYIDDDFGELITFNNSNLTPEVDGKNGQKTDIG
jgi:cation diffusion facilitator family transporter